MSTAPLAIRRSTKMPGYNSPDLDEAHSHPSSYSYSSTLSPGTTGISSLSIQTEPLDLPLSSLAWTAPVGRPRDFHDYPDNASVHSGDAGEYVLSSGQATPKGTNFRRSRPLDIAWNTARNASAQSSMSGAMAMSRGNSYRSHASSRLSNLDAQGSSGLFVDETHLASPSMGLESCFLNGSDVATTSPLFWEPSLAMNMGTSLDTAGNSSAIFPGSNQLHISPSDMQIGPDASVEGSSSPSSLDCFSSPDSSPETFDDKPWFPAPMSPPISSSDMLEHPQSDQSACSVEDKLLLLLDDKMDQTSAYVPRRLRAEGESARDHALYKNAAPLADGLYHCPWEGQPVCNHRPEKLKCNYDKFVDSHLKPYRCKAETCEGNRFSSTACLLRHEREAHGLHGHGDKPFLCRYAGCERSLPGGGFPRQWNLRDHMKRVHNDYGMVNKESQSQSSSTAANNNNNNNNNNAASNKNRKRKPQASADAPCNSGKKNVAKPVPASAETTSTRPLLEQWMAHQRMVEKLIRELNKPEDAQNLQQITEMQKRLAAMSKLTTDLSTLPRMSSR